MSINRLNHAAFVVPGTHGATKDERQAAIRIHTALLSQRPVNPEDARTVTAAAWRIVAALAPRRDRVGLLARLALAEREAALSEHIGADYERAEGGQCR
jgi:hypothetical protein